MWRLNQTQNNEPLSSFLVHINFEPNKNNVSAQKMCDTLIHARYSTSKCLQQMSYKLNHETYVAELTAANCWRT